MDGVHLAFANLDDPLFFLQGFLELMSPTEVFACENGTLFFFQDDNFFLAFGEIVFVFCVFSVFLSMNFHVDLPSVL